MESRRGLLLAKSATLGMLSISRKLLMAVIYLL